MLLLLISFVAGVLTVLAPCTLPLLPIIIGSSVSGEETKAKNKTKAFTIAVSLGLSIIIFTLLLKFSTFFISVPQSVWTLVSGGIIILFGLVSIFPGLWDRIPLVNRLSIKSNEALSAGYRKQSFWGDVIIGASLGPVFSTCSPTYFVILATVLPQSFFLGLTDLFAYAVGLSGALLVIAFLGQSLIARLGGISDTHGAFRRTLGAIFIVLGLFVILGVDKQIESALLNNGLFDITKIEQSLLKLNDKSVSTIVDDTGLETDVTTSKKRGPKAPELVHPSGFINTGGQPITIAQFKGKKVILLDIWTYSCINCQRTLPYLKSWYDKYKDMGLEIISIHTPEFAFEKVQSNVEDAVKRFGIEYPVVMDNDYGTWNALGNQYWPRKYLINENGEIIYDHIGEGNYDETEKAIQEALSELNNKVISAPKTDIQPVAIQAGSPETYFGSARNQYLGNGRAGVSGQQDFVAPSIVLLNTLYLSGTWNLTPESAGSVSDSGVTYKYNAGDVYLVASGVNNNELAQIEVWQDGHKVSVESGVDVKNGVVIVGKSRLYKIIHNGTPGEHTLELRVKSGTVEMYAFTFG